MSSDEPPALASAAVPPPLPPAQARPPGAVRVSVGLVLFGLWEVVSTIVGVWNADFSQGFHLDLGSFLTFLAYWLAAWLVWTNRRFIWPLMAYLCAIALGGLVGVVIGTWLAVPARLVRAALHETVWGEAGSFALLAWFVYPAFVIWLLAESLRATRLTRSSVQKLAPLLRPAAVIGYSATMHALAVAALFSLLQGSWTHEAVARAKAAMKEGDRYDYLVINYQAHVANGKGRHRARVLAYDENGFEPIDLAWQD